jgi:hypothetical protein
MNDKNRFMKYLKVYIAIFFLLASCKQNNAIKKANKNSSSKTYFSQKPIRYYNDFDYSKSEIENFDNGYVYTFSVNKCKFKLFSNPDSLGDLEMQYLSGDKWQKNFKTFYGFNGNYCEVDINHDGFNDFQTNMRNGSYVFLFDKNKNKFSDMPINLAFENELIDTLSNTYFQIWKQNQPEWTSDLYKFNGLDQYNLYTIKFIESTTSMHSAGDIRLYQCINGNISDTIFVKQLINKKDFYEFDYKKFWTSFLNK